MRSKAAHRPARAAACGLAALLWSALAGAAEAPFVWNLQGPQAHHVLMGSVHVLPASAYPLPAGLEAAYAGTAGLVLETDASALDAVEFQAQMLQAAMAPQGLKRTIRPQLYGDLQQRATRLKLPMALCDPFKAWFCALSLELFSLQNQGITGDHGLDRHFYRRAVQDGRPVRWLEEPAEQLALFTQMGDTLSEQFLASTLQGLGEPGRDAADVIRQWQGNDVAALRSLVDDMRRDFPQAYERLLAARNRAWMTRLQSLFSEDRPQLVIVGAAHLVGPDGLPTLLAARGWKLQPAEDPVLAQEARGREPPL